MVSIGLCDLGRLLPADPRAATCYPPPPTACSAWTRPVPPGGRDRSLQVLVPRPAPVAPAGKGAGAWEHSHPDSVPPDDEGDLPAPRVDEAGPAGVQRDVLPVPRAEADGGVVERLPSGLHDWGTGNRLQGRRQATGARGRDETSRGPGFWNRCQSSSKPPFSMPGVALNCDKGRSAAGSLHVLGHRSLQPLGPAQGMLSVSCVWEACADPSPAPCHTATLPPFLP